MCLPKKTLIQYKNAIKEVKQKLKTVELEWQNLDEAVKKDFVNVELYKSDKLSYYDCSFYPNTYLVRQLRKLFAGI